MPKKQAHSRKRTGAKRTWPHVPSGYVLVPTPFFTELLTDATGLLTETDNQDAEREVAEFFERRPLYCAIAGRYAELAREMSKLPQHSPKQKELEQRFRKLEAYLEPMYEKLKPDQERMILSFAASLIEGTIRWKGQPIRTWEDVKWLTDEFAKRIRARPVGHPVDYRYRVTEALEIKLSHPSRAWREIAQMMKIRFEDLPRQVQFLKQLLREEGIPIPPHQANK